MAKQKETAHRFTATDGKGTIVLPTQQVVIWLEKSTALGSNKTWPC